MVVRAIAKRSADSGLARASPTVLGRQHLVRADRVAHRARHRADRVERGRQRQRALGGTSRAVLLKPTMPYSAAGMRIEPPVSEPSPTNAAPVATDTAAPEDEPPGMRGTAGSHGLAGVP